VAPRQLLPRQKQVRHIVPQSCGGKRRVRGISLPGWTSPDLQPHFQDGEHLSGSYCRCGHGQHYYTPLWPIEKTGERCAAAAREAASPVYHRDEQHKQGVNGRSMETICALDMAVARRLPITRSHSPSRVSKSKPGFPVKDQGPTPQ